MVDDNGLALSMALSNNCMTVLPMHEQPVYSILCMSIYSILYMFTLYTLSTLYMSTLYTLYSLSKLSMSIV